MPVVRCRYIRAGLVLALAGEALWAAGCGKDAGGGTPREKARRVAAIADQPTRGGGQALARAMEDPDPGVRKMALVGLSGQLTAEHRPVIERAAKDPRPDVRAGAAVTLSLYKDQAAAHKLGELLAGDADEGVRLAAASGLGMNPTDKAVVLLMDNAEKDPSGAVRLRAMKGVMARLGLRMLPAVQPEGHEWRSLVEEMKHAKLVQAAYAACGASLVYHPENKTPDPPEHKP
jgi:hypothetical protein